KEERRRVTDDLDLAREAPEHPAISSETGNHQRYQGDDAQRMGLAKPAVLENPEASQASDGGGDDIQLADPVPPGDLLVADQGKESSCHCNQADRRVPCSERG